MLSILIVAASLITQAYIFRDVENWESNVEVDMLGRYREDVLAEAEAEVDRSSAESDSSRDEGGKEGR